MPKKEKPEINKEETIPEKNPFLVKYTPLNRLREDSTKIVAIVAETVLDDKVKIPCGMAAAQAAHAVSKLKLLYTNRISTGDGSQSSLLVSVSPVTTIVLKARDEKELLHVLSLAEDKGLLCVCFYDENENLYGNMRVITAVAIGPLHSDEFAGVTDYLPLWKCGCEAVLK